ncbi:MAG: TonB family protein [Acidobacteriota bacterium]|jgi:protein TonB|nr:TonB family protein [Acidobacteriota bacterium]
MLDKLVVSKNTTKENRRTGNFLITSFLAITSVLTVGLVYSLFSYNLAMGNDSLNISTLVAPVMETEAKPDIINKQPKSEKAEPNNSKEITRKTVTLRINENPKVPDRISVIPSDVKSRPDVPYKLSTVDSKEFSASISSDTRSNNNSASSIGMPDLKGNTKPTEIVVKKPEIAEPPPLKKETPPIEKKETPTVSGGVVNGKAINLVTPVYSQAAKSMNISGKVTVQVLIDEDGNIVSAEAIDGNPLLRQSAVRAARASKFSPTLLSKQKVKVSGVIIYNFIK